MRGVFLACADENIREEIRDGLNWKQSDFVLLGEASDGQLSLPMIRDLRPDVLIADADMPFLNGFELAGLVRRDFPWIRVIMLCKDLSRAQTHSDFCSQLLMPVSLYELEEALQRAVELQAEEEMQLKKRIYDSAAMIVLRHSNSNRSLERFLNKGEDPRHYFWENDHRYTRLVSLSQIPRNLTAEVWGILRLYEEQYRNIGEVMAVELPDGYGILIRDDDAVRLESRAYRLAVMTQNAIRRFTGIELRMQVGRRMDDKSQVPDSWREICELQRIQTDKRMILGVGDDLRNWRPISGEVGALEERIYGMQSEDVDGVLQYYKKKGVLYGPLFAKAVNALTEECGGVGSAQPQSEVQMMKRQLLEAIEYRETHEPNLLDLPICRARHYAGENFLKPGPLIYGAAQQAGMTVNHLSVVFRQEMGITFTEYLLRMRVNASKTLLLTPMRISRIAETVGLNGVSYYQGLFRQFTGMDPREYRRRHAPQI